MLREWDLGVVSSDEWTRVLTDQLTLRSWTRGETKAAKRLRKAPAIRQMRPAESGAPATAVGGAGSTRLDSRSSSEAEGPSLQAGLTQAQFAVERVVAV